MTNEQQKQQLGVLASVGAALLFGFSPVLVSFANAIGCNAETMVFLRNLFAIPMALLWAVLQKQSLRITKVQFFHLLWIGVFGVGAASLTLYSSYQYVGVGIATVLHFLYPVFAALLAFAIYKDKIPKLRIFALGIACIGLSFFMQGGNISLFGIAIALLSGVCYALYMVGMEKHGITKMQTSVMTFWFACIVSCTMFLYGLGTQTLTLTLPAPVWGYAILIAACTSFGATALLQIGVRYLNAGKAAVFCLFEPISGVLFGCIFLHEVISSSVIIGSSIIVLALLVILYENKIIAAYANRDGLNRKRT